MAPVIVLPLMLHWDTGSPIYLPSNTLLYGTTTDNTEKTREKRPCILCAGTLNIPDLKDWMGANTFTPLTADLCRVFHEAERKVLLYKGTVYPLKSFELNKDKEFLIPYKIAQAFFVPPDPLPPIATAPITVADLAYDAEKMDNGTYHCDLAKRLNKSCAHISSAAGNNYLGCGD